MFIIEVTIKITLDANKHKAYYMEVLLKSQDQGFISLAAWCLKDNHVHLAKKWECVFCPDGQKIHFFI